MTQTRNQNSNDWITSEELAARLGMSVSRIQGWRCEGFGPAYVKLGDGKKAAVRYRLQDVVEWEQSRVRVVPSVSANFEAAHGGV